MCKPLVGAPADHPAHLLWPRRRCDTRGCEGSCCAPFRFCHPCVLERMTEYAGAFDFLGPADHEAGD